MITGFITMGARPFHKGHEALIEYAKANCDKLIVFIADPRIEGEIPLKYRLHWVLSTYIDDPQLEVYGDYMKEPKFDSDDEKSVWWGKQMKERYGPIDRVFSSENYGDVFAKAIGAENWVFNESRSIIPVSGTMIRNRPLTNWHFINNFAKDYFVKKIVIVGTESTGKTVLTKQLAKHYNTEYVDEIGRDLFPTNGTGTIDDLKLIGIKHAESIIKHLRLSNKLLFIDTDVNITKSYADFLFNGNIEFAPWIEKANKGDLYIYLLPSAPFIQDGTRLEEVKRNELNESHISRYNNNKTIFIEYENSYEKRFEHIKEEINKFINKY